MFKNKLQEYCQRKKLELPIYRTEQLISSAHNPKYKSVSTITLPDGTVLSAKGKILRRKKDAEISAAEYLLEKLNGHLDKTKLRFTAKEQVKILIDLENVPLLDFLDTYKFDNKYTFETFSTCHSTALVNRTKFSNKVQVHTVKSTRRDAADILMVLYVSSLIPSNEKIHMIIVTNDHFFHSLMDCLDELKPESFSSYKSVNSLDELVNYLTSLQ